MRTQEVSKDLYENPFCTFSRKELEKSLYGVWESEPVGVGHPSAWCALSQTDSSKGLRTKSGLVFFSFSRFFSTPTHYPALNPSPICLSRSSLRQSPPQLFIPPWHSSLPSCSHAPFTVISAVNIREITPWDYRDSSLEAALLWFTRDCSCWNLSMGLHQPWYPDSC